MSYIRDMPLKAWGLDLFQNLGTQFNIQLRQKHTMVSDREKLWKIQGKILTCILRTTQVFAYFTNIGHNWNKDSEFKGGSMA